MWDYLPSITVSFAALELLIVVLTIPWVLTIKRDSTSALAWCLVVILLPVIGFLLFVVFGYNHVYRPVKRKRRHRARYRAKQSADGLSGPRQRDKEDAGWQNLGDLAVKFGGFPISYGNEVTLYHETQRAFDEMFDAMRDARSHIHLEYFIVQPDSTGGRLVDLLVQKAKEGVEVRLLYDAIGSLYLKSRIIRPLVRAGGKCSTFLALNPLRRRFQVNMRNHRKMAIVDGRVGFAGGINIGDEYLGKDPSFGYWRDEHLRLEGPAVADLQRIFAEDWDFAYEEQLKGSKYFPNLPEVGDARVQIIDSGPDQETHGWRELVFAAILGARERLWIATPYFVPDVGILDALRLACHRGVDVRLLVPQRPDNWLAYFAGRFYWQELLNAGLKIYQYSKGMMHSKMMAVDDQWGWVGSANLDNRSLHLNFEANCVLHSPDIIAELEGAFSADFRDSIRVDAGAFSKRAFKARLAENACRLLSPLL